jgi:hypothetical protein
VATKGGERKMSEKERAVAEALNELEKEKGFSYWKQWLESEDIKKSFSLGFAAGLKQAKKEVVIELNRISRCGVCDTSLKLVLKRLLALQEEEKK